MHFLVLKNNSTIKCRAFIRDDIDSQEAIHNQKKANKINETPPYYDVLRLYTMLNSLFTEDDISALFQAPGVKEV